ncbi:hypothetical protein BH11PSE11_BH11PSE11_22130 [soil metagenome]
MKLQHAFFALPFALALALSLSPSAGLAAESSPNAAVASTQAAVPAGVDEMLKHMSQAWADRKLDEVMRDFHPDFKSIGRNKEVQRKFYEEQLFPNVKRWELSLNSFRQEGNIAHVMLNIRTERGDIPFPTQLILDGGRWYLYGNRE